VDVRAGPGTGQIVPRARPKGGKPCGLLTRGNVANRAPWRVTLFLSWHGGTSVTIPGSHAGRDVYRLERATHGAPVKLVERGGQRVYLVVVRITRAREYLGFLQQSA